MKNKIAIKFLIYLLAIVFVISILPTGIAASSGNLEDPEDVEHDTSEEEISEWKTLYSASNIDIESQQEEGTEENSGSNPTLPLSPIVPKNNGDTAGLYVIDDPSLDNPIDPGSQYVSNGVYALENVGHAGFWMEMQDTDSGTGARMWQKSSVISPVNSFTRSCLFKISRIEGTNRYVIRSMLNNRISFRVIGTEVVGVEIPPDDDDVNIYNTFYITFNSTGYVIKQYGSTNYITAPSTLVSGSANNTVADLTAGSLSSGGNRSKWVLRRYTGADRSGVDVLVSPTSWEFGAKVGTEYLLKLKTWSTKIGANTPHIDVHEDYKEKVNVHWDSTTSTLHVTPKKSGALVIKSDIFYDDIDSEYTTFNSTYYIVPDINGDTAFLKNASTGNYMEVANASISEGANVQQCSFHLQSHAKWVFEVTTDGYFYIKSLLSNMYLGIDPSNTTYVKQYATASDYTKWRLDQNGPSKYKIACKATESTDMVLSSTGTGGDDLELRMCVYEEEAPYLDEWIIFNDLGEYYGVLQYWVSDDQYVGYWDHVPTIYIENKKSSPTFYFDISVEYAIQQWEEALNITFGYASEEEADIRIYGVDKSQFEEMTQDEWPFAAAGTTAMRMEGAKHAVYDGDLKLICEMTGADVYIRNEEDYALLPIQLAAVCTHELGHALGYRGHSESNLDLMYWEISSVFSLTERDVNHITYIHSLMD